MWLTDGFLVQLHTGRKLQRDRRYYHHLFRGILVKRLFGGRECSKGPLLELASTLRNHAVQLALLRSSGERGLFGGDRDARNGACARDRHDVAVHAFAFAEQLPRYLAAAGKPELFGDMRQQRWTRRITSIWGSCRSKTALRRRRQIACTGKNPTSSRS